MPYNYSTVAKIAIYTQVSPHVVTLSFPTSFNMHICNVQHREVLLTPLQATDPGGTITMVTGSGRSFTRQIKTEDTPVQETNPATPGELVFRTFIIPVIR